MTRLGPTLAAILLAVGTAAGCSVAPSPTPAPPSSAPSGPPTTTAIPTEAPSSASPSAAIVPTQTPAPTATPTPVPTDCPVTADDGRLPSDRLVGVEISEGASSDVVTFVFGAPSSASPPQGASSGHLELATGPFVEGGSGRPLDVPGERVVFVRFEGMTLYDDAGTATYDGPPRFQVDGAALRSVVNSEAFEGVSGWYIGFDGPGCVTLASAAGRVNLVIAHDAG